MLRRGLKHVMHSETTDINSRVSFDFTVQYIISKYYKFYKCDINTKIRFHKTIIRQVALCGAESWMLNKVRKVSLLFFKEKISEIILDQ